MMGSYALLSPKASECSCVTASRLHPRTPTPDRRVHGPGQEHAEGPSRVTVAGASPPLARQIARFPPEAHSETR